MFSSLCLISLLLVGLIDSSSSLLLLLVNAQNTTSTANETTTTTTTTTTTIIQTSTILPPITTTSGQLPESDEPLEVMMKFQPKITPESHTNILEVVKEVMKVRSGLRDLLRQDLTEFLNLPSESIEIGEIYGQESSGTFSGKVTFTNVYNQTAYLYHLKYYESSSVVVPHGAYPRVTNTVTGTETSVSATVGVTVTVEGVKLVEAKHVTTDNTDAVCFLGQDKCTIAYIIILVIVVIVGALIYFGMKKLFNFWKDTAPTRDKTFNQEGMHDMSGMNEISNDRSNINTNTTANDDAEQLLMQSNYPHHQQQQRASTNSLSTSAAAAQQPSQSRSQNNNNDGDVADML